MHTSHRARTRCASSRGVCCVRDRRAACRVRVCACVCVVVQVQVAQLSRCSRLGLTQTTDACGMRGGL